MSPSKVHAGPDKSRISSIRSYFVMHESTEWPIIPSSAGEASNIPFVEIMRYEAHLSGQ
jgi:hypothetical protein